MAKLQSAAQIDTSDARRLLLAGAGLLHNPDRAPSSLDLVRRLSFIQLDSINVIERAHELILHTRSNTYRREEIFRHLRSGKLFEHWTHDASLIPIDSYRYWHHRFARFESRGWHLSRLGPGAAELAPKILARIREEGPLMSRDFDHSGEKRQGGWWNWKPAKAVLEYLWRTGQLAISDRKNFQKVYDLPQRHLPAATEARATRNKTIEWACATALERLGLATPAELAAFHRLIELPEARAWTHEGLRSGRLIPVAVGGRTSIAFADVHKRIKRLPDPPRQVRLLAPFDPLIRDRDRASRLFNFHYRFEAFTPEHKRVHGYYVLPLLYGQELVGRADAKFDRPRSTLRLTLHPFEPGFTPDRAFRNALDTATIRLQHFINADHLEIKQSSSNRRAKLA